MIPLALAAFVLAALITPDAAGAQAGTIYACASTRDGSLRLVPSPDQCKPGKETSVSWNVAGPPGPAASSLHVFDVVGHDLGLFAPTTGGSPWFGIYLSAVEATISVSQAGALIPDGGTSAYFSDPDCRGSAYVAPGLAGMIGCTGADGCQRFFRGRPQAPYDYGLPLQSLLMAGCVNGSYTNAAVIPADEITLEALGLPLVLCAPLTYCLEGPLYVAPGAE